jgi:CpXC motif protein
MQRETLCYCGNTVTHDYPEKLDVSESGTIDSILEGTFLEVTCDSCGATLKPDFPVLLEQVPSPFGYITVEYFPEPERVRYLSGKIKSRADRVVIGYPELREKIMIFHGQLDDRAVEILKFLLMEKADTTDTLSILLEQIGDQELSFYIYGLKEKEVGVTGIPSTLYQRVFESLDERMKDEVFAQITQPPYISINKITLEEGEE